MSYSKTKHFKAEIFTAAAALNNFLYTRRLVFSDTLVEGGAVRQEVGTVSQRCSVDILPPTPLPHLKTFSTRDERMSTMGLTDTD